jgi:tetratricopeptide (TPR) repeat protein
MSLDEQETQEWKRRHRNAFDTALRFAAIGEHDRASGLLAQVVEAFPKWAEARYHLGLAYANSRRREKAQEQYHALRELDPDRARELYRMIASR